VSDVLKRQLAQLKRRVAELEGQLASRQSAPQPPDHQADSVLVARAEELFDQLLSAQPTNLVTYSRAYREVIGDYDEWRNAVHAPEIIRVARRTKPRTVAGLTVRLDALIVGKKTGSPAPGHFAASGYSEAVWQTKFGRHPVLS
jgi:hypothetical protein